MAPPGGSSTLYGVLYQLLGSLHHAVYLRLQRRRDRVLGARIVVEPTGGGGDLRIELPHGRRIVEQWKARTTGKAWSLKEIIDKVFPDLYLDPALNRPDDRTEYVFATEGWPNEEAQAFFDRLRDPLTGLHRGDRTVLRKMAAAVRRRKQFRTEPDSLTYPKLRRLLSRFEIRGHREGQQARRGDRPAATGYGGLCRRYRSNAGPPLRHDPAQSGWQGKQERVYA